MRHPDIRTCFDHNKDDTLLLTFQPNPPIGGIYVFDTSDNLLINEEQPMWLIEHVSCMNIRSLACKTHMSQLFIQMTCPPLHKQHFM